MLKIYVTCKALAWMVQALIYSQKLSLSAWEPYVKSRATQAQSIGRRWHRFLFNARISVSAIYLPLVLAALHQWKKHRLYLALDTTLLWSSRAITVASHRTQERLR